MRQWELEQAFKVDGYVADWQVDGSGGGFAPFRVFSAGGIAEDDNLTRSNIDHDVLGNAGGCVKARLNIQIVVQRGLGDLYDQLGRVGMSMLEHVSGPSYGGDIRLRPGVAAGGRVLNFDGLTFGNGG